MKPKFSLTLLLFFFCIMTDLNALPLSWEKIFTQNYEVKQAQISPDGKYVAVYINQADRPGIYKYSFETKVLEFWVKGNNPFWFNDSKTIVFNNQNDLWSIGLESDEAFRITNDNLDERAARPSPNGKTIAFYSGRSGYQDIWLIDIDENAVPKQLTTNSMDLDDFRYAPAWSPDGAFISFFSNKNNYWEDDIYIIDVVSKEERKLSSELMAMSTPVWSPDGSKIALMGTSKNEFWYEDLSYIYVLDIENDTEEILSMQIHATDLLHKHTITWSADGSEIYFPYQERSEVELWRVPSVGGVATRLTNMGGSFFQYHADKKVENFIFVRSTSIRGFEVDCIQASGGEQFSLTKVSTQWDGLIEPIEISYKSFDGLYLQAFLYLPPNFAPSHKYPSLVMVHGGGTNTYYLKLNLYEQYMAQQGYVVMAVNYRGGSGFGREFQDLSINDWGNAQAVDAAWAAHYIRKQKWSNDKVGIYGYSYGGITTMAAISREPFAFDAAVAMGGIYDFRDAYLNADRIGKIFIKTGHSGSPEEKPEIYAISNALSRVHQVKTPLLLMHGEADVRAPFRQFELAVEILDKENVIFDAKSYPNEPHHFNNPYNYVDMYSKLEAWFEKYLK